LNILKTSATCFGSSYKPSSGCTVIERFHIKQPTAERKTCVAANAALLFDWSNVSSIEKQHNVMRALAHGERAFNNYMHALIQPSASGNAQ
jgi:hypothetical protein